MELCPGERLAGVFQLQRIVENSGSTSVFFARNRPQQDSLMTNNRVLANPLVENRGLTRWVAGRGGVIVGRIAAKIDFVAAEN